MKKLLACDRLSVWFTLLCGALALSVALGSCGTTGTATTGTTTTSIIADAQKIAVQICGFLPTAATVAGILSAGNPAVATAAGIAQAICTALAAVPKVGGKRLGGPGPSVMGVPIHGKFVR